MFSVMNPTTIFVPRRKQASSIFMASSVKNTELLRTQLHQLHSEAQRTRDKASNVRLRLMRLSEAAVKLQQQAATDVRNGRENEARDLLVQKRKVMQALEKSKCRIEMLDELLHKLNEAISAKETQLIGNVSSGLEVGREISSTNIRIVSPKEDSSDLLNEDEETDSVVTQHAENYGLQRLEEEDSDTTSNLQKEDIEVGSLSMDIWNEAELVNGLKDISSYEEFLKHIDKQLNKIEVELVTFLRLSTLVLENEEKPKNSKAKQALDILENVQGIRKRISSITNIKAGIN